VHLNGLITLVQAAGGLHSITLNPKTRRFILLCGPITPTQPYRTSTNTSSRTDLAASITLQKKFYLSPTLQSSNLALYFGPPTPATSSYARNLSTRLFYFSDSSQLSRRAQTLFWGLRNLSLLLEDIRAGRASPDTPNAYDLQFTDRVEALERLAHSLWYHDSSETPTDPSPDSCPREHAQAPPPPPPLPANTTIFVLLGHATLIYIYTILRELPPELGMLKLVSMRITTILEHLPLTQQNLLLGTFQDLMVWVMFLGGSVAAPREKVVLAKMVSRILLVNRCESEEGILEASHRFLWPEVCGGDTLAAGEGAGDMRVGGGGRGEERFEVG
jgi:Fungal specific transcription factor domain